MKDCVGKQILSKDGTGMKSVFLFAFYSVIDKRSYIKFYRYDSKQFSFQFEKETQF
jgi:hypothetical protein